MIYIKINDETDIYAWNTDWAILIFFRIIVLIYQSIYF